MSPISGVRPTAARAPPVAIIAFDGMQSHRWAAPPITSCSITVTSAPRRAAWVAAVLPAGPPPMITKRSATAREATDPPPRAGHGRPRGDRYSRTVVPRSVLSRATDAVANRLDRRSFIARSALVGSALVTAPTDLLLRPTTAYAAVCSCLGQSCTCGSLCCDGYTEFCCAIYGANALPLRAR